MIFIQEALKQAFSDLGYNNIQYWTITSTKGDRYNVVYKQKGENINEKNITTANFLAYAAALFGELSRTAENQEKPRMIRNRNREQERSSQERLQICGSCGKCRHVRMLYNVMIMDRLNMLCFRKILLHMTAIFI